MTSLSPEAQLELAAEIAEDITDQTSSRPTPFRGAPDLGLPHPGPAWDDMPLAANPAFGEA